MKHLVIGVMLASRLIVSAQAARSNNDFVIVRGAEYEGAIVPASSFWHKIVWDHPAIRHEYMVVEGWTPAGEQVAAAERALQRFIELARQRTIATNSPATSSPILLRVDLESHGFPDVPRERWQTEAILMLGGARTQFWLDFDTLTLPRRPPVATARLVVPVWRRLSSPGPPVSAQARRQSAP